MQAYQAHQVHFENVDFVPLTESVFGFRGKSKVQLGEYRVVPRRLRRQRLVLHKSRLSLKKTPYYKAKK